MSNCIVTEGALRQALCAGQITAALQPVVHAPDGMLNGLEVLARWNLPDGSVISPDAFIAQATRSGQEAAITRELMVKVSPVVCQLASSLKHPLIVGFNAGPGCLANPSFEEACSRFINTCHKDGVILAIEITEREPLTPALLPYLSRLRALGAKIVLDDLGAGYATVDVFPELVPEVVKLDRALTALAGAGDPEGRLACLLGAVQRFGATILAEGVETYREFNWLYGHGVRLFQGYLFGKPITLGDHDNIIHTEFLNFKKKYELSYAE